MSEEKAAARTLYVYKMPKSIADETGIKNIAVAALTAEDELMAVRRANGSTHRLGFELAKQALVMVNDKPVSSGDATIDRAWEQLGSRGRRLVTDAASELTAPKEDELTDFRASRTVVAG